MPFATRSWIAVSLVIAWSPPLLAQTAPRFGRSVSSADVNGDGFTDVIVGEPGYDGSVVDEGRVLVFHGSPSGPLSTPSWSRRGMQVGAHFGATVAGLGDVNGDGFEDVAVGAPDFDAPRPSRTAGPGAAQLATFRGSGAFAVFLGTPGGLAASPALFRPGIDHEEHVGATLARAGDVNGDGFDDVLVGATGTDNGVGAAFVFLGSASGPEPLPDWIGQPTFLEQGTGYASALAGNGDVNNDGFADIAVGAPNGGPGGRGAATVYHGSASGPAPFGSWSLPSNPNGDGPLDNGNNAWGTCVSFGNTNGNLYDELVVGDPYYDGDLGHGAGQNYDTGVVFLFAGSASGLSVVTQRATGSVSAPSGVGDNVVVVPDLTGDGRDETFFDGGFLRYGSPSHWGSISGVGGTFFGGGFGTAISPGGDVDGDTRFDLLISDPLVDFDTPDEGVVYVYRGVAGALSGSPDWVLMAP